MKFQYVIQNNVSNENIRQMKKKKEKFNIQNIAIFKLIIKKRLFEKNFILSHLKRNTKGGSLKHKIIRDNLYVFQVCIFQEVC